MIDDVIQTTLDKKLIAIVRGMEESQILPLAEALRDGGIRMIEVTFSLKNPDSFSGTARSIAAMKKAFGGEVLVGAGTVVSPELVDIAADAGAEYIISPNVDAGVIRRTIERGLVSMPGALTPSECMAAHNAGAHFIKLFPAGNFGPGYLKALRAPLSHIRFLAVGGINEKTLGGYLEAGAVGFGIGGNLVNAEWIAAGEYGKITALARQYVEAVNG